MRALFRATVTSSMGALKRLRTLSAEGNRLEHLPESVGGCESLRTLTLSVNRLRILPATALAGCAALLPQLLNHNYQRGTQIIIFDHRPTEERRCHANRAL